MERAVDFIEEEFAKFPRLDIEDFSVLTGRRLGSKFKTGFIEKVANKIAELSDLYEEQRRATNADGIV
jgi:hypothetical protein